ncbi:TPA: hypothetical protein RQO67_002747 [Klebsiella michiganensis]|nr:hypothetical protein [Klebsiella michiganensis]
MAPGQAQNIPDRFGRHPAKNRGGREKVFFIYPGFCLYPAVIPFLKNMPLTQAEYHSGYYCFAVNHMKFA